MIYIHRLKKLEISGGMWAVIRRKRRELGWRPVGIPECRFGIDSKEKEAYLLPYAMEIKKHIKIPLILVGGLRSLSVIEQILCNGDADFIGLSRPLIREPNLPNKWLLGEKDTCDCISCNGCVATIISGKVICTQINR